MAGLGQSSSQPVSVPVGPLVTPTTTPTAPNVVDAVGAMADAFRKGQITSEDLVQRFGMEARAKTQLGTAQAESALPLVQPQAELLANQIGAQTAAAQWGQPSLDTFRNTLGWYGDDLSAYQLPNGKPDYTKMAKTGAQRQAELGQLDHWAQLLTKTEDRTIILPSGAPKHIRINSMGEDVTPSDGIMDASPRYKQYVAQMSQYMPKGHPYARQFPSAKPPGVVPYVGVAHAAGDPEGIAHPDVNHLPAEQQAAIKSALAAGPFVTPVPTQPGSPTVDSEGRPFPVFQNVTAESPQMGALRANLVNSGKSEQEVLAMTKEQVAAETPIKDLVQVATGSAPTPPQITPLASPPVAAALPVVAPSAAVSPDIDPATGLVKYFSTQGVSPGGIDEKQLHTAQSIRSDLHKEPTFAVWQKSIPYATTFEKNAAEVRNLTPAQQAGKNLNLTDLGLAESLIKLYDPDGVIREFKWDKFESSQPRLDLLKHAKEIAVLRNGSFTPDTRALLIKMGEDVIKGREEAALPIIEMGYNRALTNPNLTDKFGTVFTSEDARVMSQRDDLTKNFSHNDARIAVARALSRSRSNQPVDSGAVRAPAFSVPPDARTPIGTIPGKGMGYIGADNMWHRVGG